LADRHRAAREGNGDRLAGDPQTWYDAPGELAGGWYGWLLKANLAKLLLVDDATDVAGLVQRITEFQRLSFRRQLCQKTIEDVLMQGPDAGARNVGTEAA
jgi:hypothetical protein